MSQQASSVLGDDWNLTWLYNEMEGKERRWNGLAQA
jgi:hypothetical protein